MGDTFSYLILSWTKFSMRSLYVTVKMVWTENIRFIQSRLQIGNGYFNNNNNNNNNNKHHYTWYSRSRQDNLVWSTSKTGSQFEQWNHLLIDIMFIYSRWILQWHCWKRCPRRRLVWGHCKWCDVHGECSHFIPFAHNSTHALSQKAFNILEFVINKTGSHQCTHAVNGQMYSGNQS